MFEIPLQDLKLQNQLLRNQLIELATKVIDSGNYVSGVEVEGFEKSLSKFCVTKYAIGVSTGSSALEIAIRSLDLPQNSEIIVPSLTFIASVEAILSAGAKPVLVDVDPYTWTLNPLLVENAINTNTRAILPVHLHGRLCDMEKLNQIAKKHALFVIEDSAQSHGAKRGDWVSGSSGDVSGFSFYPGKNLGALGEAGAITTNSESINENCRLIRNYGSRNKYQHIIRGNNFRMDEIQAAFLNLKINYLESWTESRIKNAKFYDEILDSFNISHTAPDSGRHVYHVYSVLVENRNEVMQKMQKSGVGVSSHYPVPCHLQKGYAGEVRIGSSLEVSENLSKQLLSLPIDENLNHSSIEKICNSLNSYL